MCLVVADGLAIQPIEFAVAFKRPRLEVAPGGDIDPEMAVRVDAAHVRIKSGGGAMHDRFA